MRIVLYCAAALLILYDYDFHMFSIALRTCNNCENRILKYTLDNNNNYQ